MALERVHQIRLHAVLRVESQRLEHLLRTLHREARHHLAHHLALLPRARQSAEIPLVEQLRRYVVRLTHVATRLLHHLRRDYFVARLLLLLRRHLRLVDHVHHSVHELLLVLLVVRQLRALRAPREHHVALLVQTHLVVLQRLVWIADHLVHRRRHRHLRSVLYRHLRHARAVALPLLALTLLLPEQLACQRRVLLCLFLHHLLLRSLHLRRDDPQLRTVQPHRLVRAQTAEPLVQRQLLTQLRLLRRRQTLRQHLRAQQRVLLLLRRRRPVRLRVTVATLVQ